MTDGNCITVLTSNKLTMTSREVSEFTGKRHRDVLRDIDNLLNALSADLRLGFKSNTYKDVTGKENRMFVMDRDSTYCLVAGYDANARMKIIKRWQELEAQQITLPDFTKPAEAARAWAFEYERAEQHRLAHVQAQQQLEVQAPAVAFHKQVTDNSETLLRIEEACALLKRKTGQDFNQTTWLRFLREQGIAKLQNKYSGIGPQTFVPKAAYVNHWFVSTMTEGGNTLWMVRPVAVEQIFQRIEQQHKNVDLLAPIARQLMARIT